MFIDYARMKRTYPKHKAALKRAQETGRYSAVLAACTDAVLEWDEIGAWPDAWATWNIALGDAATKKAYATVTMPAIIHLDQIFDQR
jgi:hypothetical protein